MVVVILGLTGLAIAAAGLLRRPNLTNTARGLNLPLAYVQAASTWATKRGLPIEWVLTTILVESGGNPRAAGDADGRSVGLMQVNAVAHAAELKAAGLSRESLFDPATNIEWGTKYLKSFYDQVQQALGGRPAPADLGEILRLAYKGPAPVLSALRKGLNPLATLSWAPDAIANWRHKLAIVRAAMQSKPPVS